MPYEPKYFGMQTGYGRWRGIIWLVVLLVALGAVAYFGHVFG